MSFNTISSAQARMLFIFPTQRSISLAFSSSATPCFLAISFIRCSAISRAEVSISARCSYNFPLHKMYTFVYRTFIKFIFFCRGQALDAIQVIWLSFLTHSNNVSLSNFSASLTFTVKYAYGSPLISSFISTDSHVSTYSLHTALACSSALIVAIGSHDV